MAVNVVSFSFSRCSTGGPGPTLLGDGFLYCTLSASSLVPKLHRGSRGPLRPGVAFPTHLVYNSVRTPTATRTPCLDFCLERPLDLWNRMFDRHQAEITVMQFTSHSLPVRKSMSVPWEFFTSSHFISQFPPTRFPLITAIRMCYLLPVHHLGMAFLAGSKAKIQQYILLKMSTSSRYLSLMVESFLLKENLQHFSGKITIQLIYLLFRHLDANCFKCWI